ncbi:MAG: tetratricopeptide repeat protein [Bacteroidetes Order II. Incertae sedis bacterium]|nr:tetratricopeptide repeat protein [Bacteroidetes Order II. bacterium]
MFYKVAFHVIWLFALIFTISGCDQYNLFSGKITVEEKVEQILKSEDPQKLLADGVQLIAEGTPAEAQKVLEKAQSLAPDNGEIRVQHANAVLLAADIDVFDLRNLADYLSTGDPGGSFTGGLPLSKLRIAEFCSDKPGGGKTPFDLNGYLSSQKLSKEDLFGVLEVILSPIFVNINPRMAQASLLAALKSKKVANIEQALLLYSLVVTVQEFNKMKKFAEQNGAIWYNFSTKANVTYLGYCTNDGTGPNAQERCQKIFAETQKSMNSLDMAVFLLETRSVLLNSTTSTELSALARDGYNALNKALQSNIACQP